MFTAINLSVSTAFANSHKMMFVFFNFLSRKGRRLVHCFWTWIDLSLLDGMKLLIFDHFLPTEIVISHVSSNTNFRHKHYLPLPHYYLIFTIK